MITGASPAGVDPGDEVEVSRNIRRMFGRIAPRYDLLNRLLSLRVDQYWRRAVVRRVRPYVEKPNARILDLCCGTGDLVIALESARKQLGAGQAIPVAGGDFCRPMLITAREKLCHKTLPSCLVEADALQVPMRDGSVDLITIAYGLRNLANYQRGLDEMYRLLADQGCLAVLEFSRPTNRFFGRLFEFYFQRILPGIGNVISGSGSAYSYLQQSVQKFPSPQQLISLMKSAGFSTVEYVALTGGISVLYLAYKGNAWRQK